ncbi:hypothetical protein [Orrella marina]|uniref:Uncharacterized protein n=1 Tax=Orrella marina TaxID=2163011 RepID=A0A2R4XM18_9BURK|nr:hypothetical protein [Orrella marina]AWB34847.1 hypothetical protein DBV39_15165 [Orrella marina]
MPAEFIASRVSGKVSKPALALTWVVGMLTLGTATPHILRAIGVLCPWQHVLAGATLLALIGGGHWSSRLAMVRIVRHPVQPCV